MKQPRRLDDFSSEVPMSNDEPEGPALRRAQSDPGNASATPGQNPPEPKADDLAREGQGAARGFREESPPTPLQATEGRNQHKQIKTAAELAKMIEMDLSRHPDCPKAGFRVTVYGWPRWQAMLTIEPAAGGIRNPREWRDLTQELAERLRRRYDLA
jgi:hypothetical protein